MSPSNLSSDIRGVSRTQLVLLGIALIALLGAALVVFGPGAPRPGGPVATPPGTTLAPGATGQPSGAPATTGPDGNPITPDPGQPAVPTPQPGKAVGSTSVPPEELTGYIWPLRNALITSRFAPRDFGGFVVIDGEEIHDGLDLATHCGDEIYAAHDGTVLYAGRNFDVYLGYRGRAEQIYARLEQRGSVNTLPIVIVIDDGNGYRSVYVHLKKANVEAGEVVNAGDVIGTEGATGYATGCHLHYGLIRIDGGWQEVVPQLARFGYPPFVRERVDPLDVLPWADQYAPQRLQDRANQTPSPTTSPTS